MTDTLTWGGDHVGGHDDVSGGGVDPPNDRHTHVGRRPCRRA